MSAYELWSFVLGLMFGLFGSQSYQDLSFWEKLGAVFLVVLFVVVLWIVLQYV